jgi:hypothetical protein
MTVNLNNEPSDSNNDTSKHDDSSEEGEDNLENNQLGIPSKGIYNKIK